MKKRIVFFEIFIVLVSTFSFAYIIHESNDFFNGVNTLTEKKKNKFLEFILKQIDIIPSISAIEVNLQCCTKTKQGAICQDMISTSNECATALIPTKCEQVSSCKIGCCIDEDEGLCSSRSTYQECTEKGGKWSDNPSCLISECSKGCCILGDNVQFITENRCSKVSTMFGFEKDFKDVETEVECLALKNSQEKGACLNNDKCSIKTETECLSEGGKFYKKLLCSNPLLNTNCEKQSSVGCVDGKDEIYWFDSCGNIENIYSSDKDASWNNGIILGKEKSCYSDSKEGNVNSQICGNCDSFKGSKCSPSNIKKIVDGNYICKSLDCSSSPETDNKNRKNGESWCVYDSFVGEGKDSVGSRHWKRSCINGEVVVEPCEDYRGQICVQSEIKENTKTFSVASCKINEALACINYNDKKDVEKLCNNNEDCLIKHVNVDKGFKFDMCVPKYPRGFDLSDENSASDELCKIANVKCTMVYQKKLFKGWKCIQNCNCNSAAFSQQMNDICISLGDCGSYINYIGEGTDNIFVAKAPYVSWTQYKSYSTPTGKYIEANLNKSLEKIGINSISDGTENIGEDKKTQAVKFLGTVLGGLGTLTRVVGYFLPASSTTQGANTVSQEVVSKVISSGAPLGYSIPPGAEVAIESGKGTLATSISGFSTFLGGISIGTMASMILTKLFGLQGDAAFIMAIAGIAAGGIIGTMLILTGQSAWSCLFGGACLIVIGFLAIVGIILSIFGIGKTKKVIAVFECNAWQAPSGGSNCDKCNNDPLKPCSKYRCNSLGQACELLNPDTKYPVCVQINKDDHTAPKISTNTISSGYKFLDEKESSVKIRKENEKCIPEFTTVQFSLKTDEYAQCRFLLEHTSIFDENGNLPFEGTAYTLNHTFGFMMPSKESLAEYEIEGIDELFGNLNFYVRCKDKNGNFNLNEYSVNFCVEEGPDITPPMITSTSPKNNGFLKYGTTETILNVFLNEPAECKYDKKDKTYETMDKVMDCGVELEDVELNGWLCTTNLTELSKDNTFYIRCKDQPKLTGENESKRNVNTESYIYTIKTSENELKIDSILPNSTIYFGIEPVSVDLEIETSGGIENGKSECYYSFSNDNYLLFFDTYSNSHKQNFNLMSGKYDIKIKCIDSSKNEVFGNAIFELIMDTTAPKIVRIYNDGGMLKLITNEKAECFYDPKFKKCGFDINNAISMTTAFSQEHKAEWIYGNTYYIKCKDIFGNVNNGCFKAIPSSNLLS